jgi:hypothetical protein
MTDHIQRFNLDPNHSGLGFYNGLTSSDEGSLVGFDDYAAAIARAEKAEAEIDALKNPPEVYCSKCGHPKSDHPFRHTFVSSE